MSRPCRKPVPTVKSKLFRENLTVIGLIAVLLAVFFYDVVFFGKTFKVTSANPQALMTGPYGQENNKPSFFSIFTTDVSLNEEPTLVFIKRSFWQGTFPMWNPHLACGYPLIALIQIGLFFPLNLLFYVLPDLIAWDALIFGRFFLAGFFIYWFFTCILIVVVFIDIEHRLVPDVFSVPGIFAGMIFSAFFLNTPAGFSGARLMASLLGVFTGAGSMFLMGFLGELVFHRQAIGGGDIKLMAMIGAFVGWKLVLLTFFMAPVLGSGFALFARLKKRDREIPYAPYMALAALISLLYGDEIIGYLFPVL